jgi:hypothetical protein
MRSLSVELKLAFTVIVLFVALSFVGAMVSGGIFERNVENAALTTLQTASDAFDAQEHSEIEKLAATLDALVANEAIRDAFVARDRKRLLALCEPLFRTIRERDRVTHWYFIEPDSARVFLRVHRPELFGDVADRPTVRKAIQTGDLGAGKELGQTAFALRAVRPWVHEGKVIGYMELGEEIDHFLTAMKSRTNDEYGLLVKKKFLDEQAWARILGPRSNTWNDRPDVVVVDTTTFTEGIIDFQGDIEQIPDRGWVLDEVQRGERAYVRGIFPVRDAAGRKVGGLFVLHDFTTHHSAMRAGLLQTFLVLLALGLVASAATIATVRALVFRRLEALRRELEDRAAEGNLPKGRLIQLRTEDEIGRLEALVHRILFPATRPSRNGVEPTRDTASGNGH